MSASCTPFYIECRARRYLSGCVLPRTGKRAEQRNAGEGGREEDGREERKEQRERGREEQRKGMIGALEEGERSGRGREEGRSRWEQVSR